MNQIMDKTIMVEAKNITKIYPNGVTALRDFSLDVRKGEFVTILGSNGSGKTTLLRCLNGLIPLTKGEIRVQQYTNNGKNSGDLRQIQKITGIIFQGANLIEELSVLMNVLIGRLSHISLLRAVTSQFRNIDKEVAFSALKKVGLQDKVYEKAGNLSGGQKQKVAIAKAMAQQPLIILADEPVANLDPKSSKEIMEFLSEISSENGITVICILHRVDFAAEYAERIIGIKGGEKVYDRDSIDFKKEDLLKIYETDHEESLPVETTSTKWTQPNINYCYR